MVDVAQNKDNIRDSLDEQFRMNRDKNREESIAAISEALDAIDKGEKPMVTIYRAVPKSLKEGSVRNGDWVTLSKPMPGSTATTPWRGLPDDGRTCTG